MLAARMQGVVINVASEAGMAGSSGQARAPKPHVCGMRRHELRL